MCAFVVAALFKNTDLYYFVNNLPTQRDTCSSPSCGLLIMGRSSYSDLLWYYPALTPSIICIISLCLWHKLNLFTPALNWNNFLKVVCVFLTQPRYGKLRTPKLADGITLDTERVAGQGILVKELFMLGHWCFWNLKMRVKLKRS